MKVLLLADIHANLPALEAVLDAAKGMGYDELWCLGDVVGYGPFPNECVRLIRQKASRVICGNHDAKVVSAKKIQQIIDEKKQAYKVFVFSWTHAALDAEAADYLVSLPETLRLNITGRRVVLVHGSPRGMSDGLTLFTPQEQLEELALKAEADIVLVGHTHEAFTREAGNVLFINPGSVGRPFDRDLRASFMILDFSTRGVEVATHRVAYDPSPVVDRMRRQSFPEILIKAFIEARSPADVLPEGVQGDLINEARKLNERHATEKAHALQVAMLALKIFDGITPLHGYGPHERVLMQVGALLHDIGIAWGPEAHHKSSRDIILEDKGLPLSERDRVVVALVARYHRRSLPKPEHSSFATLPDPHKVLVRRLAGIVRMADGLDRTHQGLVKDIEIDIMQDAMIFRLSADGDVRAEMDFGQQKSDLFEQAFGKKVMFEQKKSV